MMKTIRYILIGFFFLTFTDVNSQDLKGIWISSHERVLRKVNERGDFQNDEFVTIKLDSIEIDTFFYQAHMILDFIDDKNVIVKGIGGYQEQSDYVIRNNKIKIKTSKGKFKCFFSNDKIVIVDKSNKTSNNETFYERITPSKITQATDLDSSKFYNTNWILNVDTNSLYYGFNYHFLDSNIVIISQDYGEYGYTNWGEFKTDIYKNHFFIGIIDRDRIEIKLYHFYDKKGKKLIGETYEYYMFSNTPPPLTNIEFVKKDLLNDNQLVKMEEKLIGKWIAINNPLSIDTAFRDLYEVDTILNQKYEIDFKYDKTFRLEKSGEIVKQADKTYKLDTLIGDWEISRTGKYIKLKPNDSWIRYLTINKLENYYLEIFSDIEAIYDEHMESNETIKLKK